MPNEIRNALLLWYDVERQGATNESMTENPILIDQSGNGYDATCYNFAWSEMSGIGGYVMDMNSFALNGRPAGITLSKTKTSIHIELTDEYAGDYSVFYPLTKWDLTKDRTFRINSTYSQGFQFIYYLTNVGDDVVDIPANGDVFVPANPDSDCVALFFNLKNIRGTGTIDIELLPVYPNALVSDGVDDYARTQGFIIPNNKFTILFDVDWIDTNNVNAGLVKSMSWWLYNQNKTNKLLTLITDATNTITVDNNIFGLSSNGNIYHKDSTITEFVDRVRAESNTADIVFGTNHSINLFTKIALRKFILFNHELTQDEIDWVSVNLLGRTLYNAPEFSIDFSKVNNGVSSFTDLTGKHTINAYNFAGKGMSGRDGYVNDFTVGYNTEPDNVTVSFNKIVYDAKNTVTQNGSWLWVMDYSDTNTIESCKYRITGITNYKLVYFYSNGTELQQNIDITSDGIYELPQSISNAEYKQQIGFYVMNRDGGAINLTIEQLPLYEGAYVFDGVDDYMKFADLNHGVRTLYMVVNPFKGGTILYNQRTNTGVLHNDFAIYNELNSQIAYSARNSGDTYINGVLNTTLTSADLLNKKHLITIVNNADTIGQEVQSVDIGEYGLAYYANMACYKLIGFNEVHTEE